MHRASFARRSGHIDRAANLERKNRPLAAAQPTFERCHGSTGRGAARGPARSCPRCGQSPRCVRIQRRAVSGELSTSGSPAGLSRHAGDARLAVLTRQGSRCRCSCAQKPRPGSRARSSRPDRAATVESGRRCPSPRFYICKDRIWGAADQPQKLHPSAGSGAARWREGSAPTLPRRVPGETKPQS